MNDQVNRARVRNEAEWDRIVAYIRANPVKAGIVARWEDHPWTK